MKEQLIWDVNLFTQGNEQSLDLWVNAISKLKGDTLFIVGAGFDPRMHSGISYLLKGKPSDDTSLQCVGLRGAAHATDNSYGAKELENIAETKRLFRDRYGELTYEPVEAGTSMSICLLVKKHEEFFSKFSNIIIDISSMPRITFLTLVPQVLILLREDIHNASSRHNLLVMASENIQYEEECVGNVQSNEVAFLHQFKGGIDIEEADELVGVWFPILGGSRLEELEVIFQKIEKKITQGVDVIPLLPFPSQNPRRSDNIISKFHNELFQSLEVSYGNLLYASEDNPFELYRRLMNSFVRYSKNLTNLGGGRFFVSPLSGKLMSVGAILACYEAKNRLNLLAGIKSTFHIGVPMVEPREYEVKEVQKSDKKPEVSMLWLLGEAYNVS